MHSIDLLESRQLVEVTLTGVIHYSERLDVLNGLLAAVARTGFTKVLVTYRPNARIALEPYERSSNIADALAGHSLLSTCRMAYIAPVGGRLDLVTEMLAYARGFAGRRFKHREDAIAWLCAAETA